MKDLACYGLGLILFATLGSMTSYEAIYGLATHDGYRLVGATINITEIKVSHVNAYYLFGLVKYINITVGFVAVIVELPTYRIFDTRIWLNEDTRGICIVEYHYAYISTTNDIDTGKLYSCGMNTILHILTLILSIVCLICAVLVVVKIYNKFTYKSSDPTDRELQRLTAERPNV